MQNNQIYRNETTFLKFSGIIKMLEKLKIVYATCSYTLKSDHSQNSDHVQRLKRLINTIIPSFVSIDIWIQNRTT